MDEAEALAALVSLPEVARIEVASLKPTDVIVVKVDGYVTPELANRIAETFERIWPNQKVIVLDRGTDMRIVSGTE